MEKSKSKSKSGSKSESKFESKPRSKSGSKNNKKVLADLESKFNTIMLGMIEFISEYYQQSHFNEMKDIAKSFVKKKPEEPIAYFLYHIYKNDEYRTNILEENDSFFLGKFEEMNDINNLDTEEVKEINTNYMVKLFEFKELWKEMDIMSQMYVKRSMKGLVQISQKYVLTL